jgi:hypothetical protein
MRARSVWGEQSELGGGQNEDESTQQPLSILHLNMRTWKTTPKKWFNVVHIISRFNIDLIHLN